MSEERRLIAGRYRLDRRIGSGAMGVVWQGHDERLNRAVAVKLLLLPPGLPEEEADEAVARCMREGRIAARLHHPNAIAVFDVVDDDGVPCLVMEYLPSESLAIALNERGPLEVAEVARIGTQVAAALAAAHAAGIVHRDIKPGNILLGDDGHTVKITDFGISRATDDVTVTKTGLIAGTPAYLAPEVAIGREPAAASDVYSLGSTLYAAVEGEPPFGLSENTLGLLHAVASGKINKPVQSGALTDVLIALLAPETADRPTAAKARDLLAAVARGERPTVPPPVAHDDDAATKLVGVGAATGKLDSPATRSRPGTIAAAPPPAAKSARPLVFASAAVAAILAAGVWLMIAMQDDDANTPTSPSNSNQAPAVTTSPPTTATSTTTRPRPAPENTPTATRGPASSATSTTPPPPSTPSSRPTTPPSEPTTRPSTPETTPPPTSAPPPTSTGGGGGGTGNGTGGGAGSGPGGGAGGGAGNALGDALGDANDVANPHSP
ncbi:serine/threonine-protein kinase [Actinokineospora sp. G85]|uniref:serine/threonine-protein kinase n=1 Tax=Actinokineospora sp. G85 TaxID=3406626 RepID=UPI003C779BFC